MSRMINPISVAVVAGKYALFVVLAGLTLTTGANAAESAMLLGLEGND